MNKKVFGTKLSRERSSREALFRQLIKSLVHEGSIVTTLAKAKAIQRDVDKLVTKAKDTSLASKRKIGATLGNDETAVATLTRIATQPRTSGFTRILKMPTRRGDNAKIAKIVWTDAVPAAPVKEAKVKKTKKANKEVKEVKTAKAPKKAAAVKKAKKA